VRTNALIEDGDLQLRELINSSRSSLRTTAVRYIPRWPWFAQIWIDSHPIACYFLFLRLPVLHTFFKCVSWLLFSVASIAASRWTNGCLHCCGVLPSGALRETPVVRIDSASIAPGGSLSGAMACDCRNVRKMIKKRSGKCWRLYSVLQVNMEWVTANLHVRFKRNPAAYSCRRFQRSRDYSKSVRCCLFVYRDTSRWMTADISCLIDINRSLFEEKDVWWCLSQDIARNLPESHTPYHVIMYC